MTTYSNDYKFTLDFNVNGGSFVNLAHLINKFGVPRNICEVGVYEGSTTFWLADNVTPHNENLNIYAIDSHDTSADLTIDLTEVQRNFQHNLSKNVYQNVEYINKPSEDGLIDMINRGIKCDLIYIDGDHRAAGVLTDLVLAWKILNAGGVILCDDTTTWKYTDHNGTMSNQMSPRLAVETFIQCNWHRLSILSLPDGTQTAFIKTSDC